MTLFGGLSVFTTGKRNQLGVCHPGLDPGSPPPFVIPEGRNPGYSCFAISRIKTLRDDERNETKVGIPDYNLRE